MSITLFIQTAFSTAKLYEVIKGVIRGREMPFPEQRADPCNSGNIYPSCPITKGEKYQFKAWFEVKPFYPPVCFLLFVVVVNTFFIKGVYL